MKKGTEDNHNQSFVGENHEQIEEVVHTPIK